MVASTQPQARRRISPFALLATIALLARLIVAPFFGFRYDVTSYLEWTSYLAHHSLSSFYGASLNTPPDHLPGDMLLFAFIGRLAIWIDPGFDFSSQMAVIAIRLVPIASDILLGLLVFYALRGRVTDRVRLLAVGIVYFNPALFTVSAIWGQWDSFAAMLLVATILLSVGNPRGSALAWPLLIFLVLIKPQAIVFAPLLLIAQLRIAMIGPEARPSQGRHHVMSYWEPVIQRLVIGMIGAMGLFLAVTAPFRVGFPGQPGVQWTIFDRIHFAIDRYTDVALGAHNVWALFGFGYGDADRQLAIGSLSFQVLGMAMMVIASLGAILVTTTLHPPTWGLWTASFILAMSIYVFPTRVHERYMLPAIICLCFMWPLLRSLLPILIGLSLTYTLSLIFTMRGESIGGETTGTVLAAINLALFVAGGVLAVRAGHPTTNLSLSKRPMILHHRT